MLLVLEELSVLHVVPAVGHGNTKVTFEDKQKKILRKDMKQVYISIKFLWFQFVCKIKEIMFNLILHNF